MTNKTVQQTFSTYKKQLKWGEV